MSLKAPMTAAEARGIWRFAIPREREQAISVMTGVMSVGVREARGFAREGGPAGQEWSRIAALIDAAGVLLKEIGDT